MHFRARSGPIQLRPEVTFCPSTPWTNRLPTVDFAAISSLNSFSDVHGILGRHDRLESLSAWSQRLTKRCLRRTRACR